MRKGGPAVSAEQAFAHYLMLGKARSIQKLADHYAATIPGGVSPHTLKFWSRRDRWPKKAQDHDARVQGLVSTSIAKVDSQAEFNKVAALMGVAQRCLELARTIELTMEGTPTELRQLVAAGVECIKLAEVLTGGVSDRVGKGESVAEATEQLDALERRIKGDQKRALN